MGKICNLFRTGIGNEKFRHGTNRAVNVSKAVRIKNLNNFSRFFLLRWHSRRLRLFRTMALLFIYAYFINLTLLIVGVTVSPIPFITLWYGVKNNSGVRSDPVGDTANPPPSSAFHCAPSDFIIHWILSNYKTIILK